MNNRTTRPFDFWNSPPHTNDHTSNWFATFLPLVLVSLRSEEEKQSTKNNLYASLHTVRCSFPLYFPGGLPFARDQENVHPSQKKKKEKNPNTSITINGKKMLTAIKLQSIQNHKLLPPAGDTEPPERSSS